MLRKIYGGQKEGDFVRRRTNAEVMSLYGDCDITTVVKTQRLRWWGHVMRMSEDRTVRGVLKGRTNIRKRRGRPKGRWCDAVLKDIELLNITNWEVKVTNRELWRNICKQAMGLYDL